MKTTGIHHITAITADVKKNHFFYTQVLGFKFVKKTVNFDDPLSYHLYYGDKKGSPGTILTFFGWDVPKGKHGSEQATQIGFAFTADHIKKTLKKLDEQHITYSKNKLFDQEVYSIEDPDGLSLALVPSKKGPSFHHVRLEVPTPIESIKVLKIMRWQTHQSQEIVRMKPLHANEPYTYVDIKESKKSGMMGAGCIHHVAFRVDHDDDELKIRSMLDELHYHPTQVIDRKYFHSVYFREPNRILFEIATDPPGFMVDEPLDKLGTSLQLPAWYEQRRKEIEQHLVKL